MIYDKPKLFRKVTASLLGLLSVMTSTYAEASEGVKLDRTRVVFQNGRSEEILGVINDLQQAMLVRASFEDQNGKPTDKIMALPSVYRLESGKSNRIRLVSVGDFPQDKESVFFVTVTFYPIVKAEENSVRYGMGHKIKVFYRPKSVTEDCRYVADQLKWRLEGSSLKVSNPTNLSISLTELDFGDAKKQVDMLLPGQEANYELNRSSNRITKFTFQYIDEFGARKIKEVSLE